MAYSSFADGEERKCRLRSSSHFLSIGTPIGEPSLSMKGSGQTAERRVSATLDEARDVSSTFFGGERETPPSCDYGNRHSVRLCGSGLGTRFGNAETRGDGAIQTSGENA